MVHTNLYFAIILDIFEVSFCVWQGDPSHHQGIGSKFSPPTQISNSKASIDPAPLVYTLCNYTGVFVYFIGGLWSDSLLEYCFNSQADLLPRLTLFKNGNSKLLAQKCKAHGKEVQFASAAFGMYSVAGGGLCRDSPNIF